MMGKKRGKEARGKKFVNKYKEIQEKIKVQRSNQEYSRKYEYEMVSTICESTEEGGQQGDEINEDGFQTHFEAKVLEKMNIEGNFENDKLGMKFKECMEIKECKDMEKVDLQESMLEYFELEEGNEFQVNHGTSLRNPVDPHLNETKKYSSLSKKVQNFQKDQPSITQETRGTSLCNPVDLHVYETKKSALKSTEAAIILKTAPETAISTCHIVDIAEALWRKGHVTFYNENQVYLVSNLIRKKVNVVKPRTDTITVRGNKIVTKGTKRKSLVEVYDYSCDFGISTCPCKLAVLRSRGHDLVTEKSNIQLKTLKNVKVRAEEILRKISEKRGIGADLTEALTEEALQMAIRRLGYQDTVPSLELVQQTYSRLRIPKLFPSEPLVDEYLTTCVLNQSWPGMTVAQSLDKGAGQGIYAKLPFYNSQVVVEYHGRRMATIEANRLLQSLLGEDDGSNYFLTVDQDVTIDAREKVCTCHPHQQCFGRLVNHKANEDSPNLKCNALVVDGLKIPFLVATRDITAGEELCFDYGVRPGQFNEGYEQMFLLPEKSRKRKRSALIELAMDETQEEVRSEEPQMDTHTSTDTQTKSHTLIHTHTHTLTYNVTHIFSHILAKKTRWKLEQFSEIFS
ncbi:hypothetical protein QYM36_009642 [Artemia franciscana]|uniref:SET domain-containing protein n=1 Tax=Artemia franciscana TaxID=6661 RepID=A0AA88HP04_ARTSF|nr:hypothetical protein QYM36_009642 [Artemia franciscana]